MLFRSIVSPISLLTISRSLSIVSRSLVELDVAWQIYDISLTGKLILKPIMLSGYKKGLITLTGKLGPSAEMSPFFQN